MPRVDGGWLGLLSGLRYQEAAASHCTVHCCPTAFSLMSLHLEWSSPDFVEISQAAPTQGGTGNTYKQRQRQYPPRFGGGRGAAGGSGASDGEARPSMTSGHRYHVSLCTSKPSRRPAVPPPEPLPVLVPDWLTVPEPQILTSG